MLNPTYDIYQDVTFVEGNAWDFGAPIVINVDVLSPDGYVYHIEVQNGAEEVEDYVIVTVTAKSGSGDLEAIQDFL
ncbi:MAG: hypothetical protein ACFFG0_56810 [Candidatus Thorarchaeota archaeon]